MKQPITDQEYQERRADIVLVNETIHDMRRSTNLQRMISAGSALSAIACGYYVAEPLFETGHPRIDVALRVASGIMSVGLGYMAIDANTRASACQTAAGNLLTHNLLAGIDADSRPSV